VHLIESQREVILIESCWNFAGLDLNVAEQTIKSEYSVEKAFFTQTGSSNRATTMKIEQDKEKVIPINIEINSRRNKCILLNHNLARSANTTTRILIMTKCPAIPLSIMSA